MKQAKYPAGWNEDRVKRVLAHYEQQSDDEAVAEDEAAYESTTQRTGALAHAGRGVGSGRAVHWCLGHGVAEMKVYSYSEARQRFADVLRQAKRDGQAQIRRRDGELFLVQPALRSGSPLDVPGVESGPRALQLVELVRASRRSTGRLLPQTPARRPGIATPRQSTPAPKAQPTMSAIRREVAPPDGWARLPALTIGRNAWLEPAAGPPRGCTRRPPGEGERPRVSGRG